MTAKTRTIPPMTMRIIGAFERAVFAKRNMPMSMTMMRRKIHIRDKPMIRVLAVCEASCSPTKVCAASWEMFELQPWKAVIFVH